MLKTDGNAIDFYGLRLFVIWSKKDCLVTTMPLPGEPQRTIQIDLDSIDLRERQVLKEEPTAFIGPTLWELEGPIPILKRSKTLVAIEHKPGKRRGSSLVQNNG